MFFQIDVTPKEKKKVEVLTKKQMNNYSLLLAPFQPSTKINLDTVIGTKIESTLTIRNTNNRPLVVTVIKTPPTERYLILSATEWCMEASTSVILNIIWEPRECGSWRDIIQLADSRHIKYDIPLILNCTDPNKAKNCKGGRKIRQKSLLRKMGTTSDGQKNGLTNEKSVTLNNNNNNNRYNTQKLPIQPALKRQSPSVIEYSDKENISNNIDFNWMIERAKSKKQKKDKPLSAPPLDFSEFLESSTFKFTPIKSKFTCFDYKTNNTNSGAEFHAQLDKTNESSFQLESSFPSMINEKQMELRKETYVTVPKYLSIQQSPQLHANHESDNEFDDSLSPKTSEIETNRHQSEISMMLNNIKFTPLRSPSIRKNDNVNFSPTRCSTAHKLDKSKSFSDDSVSYSAYNNVTFDINLSNNFKDSTYELPVSSAKATNNFQFKPICLAETFEQQNLDSTSNNFNKTNDYARFSNMFVKSQIDAGSVKDCLEADLWVKLNDTKSTPMSKNIFHSNLDNIKANKDVNDGIDNCHKIQKIPKAFCLKISPPKKYSGKTPIRKISLGKNSKIIKEKHIAEPMNLKNKTQIYNSMKANENTTDVKIAKLPLAVLLKDKNNLKCVKKQAKDIGIKPHDPNDFLTMFCNPDPFAASMTHDPFLSSTLYYDDKWMFIQELEFKKWLNALLTAPEHLTTDIESTTIDIGKVWQSCRAKEDITLAETKESISARYHTNTRLNTLRKAACIMFGKAEVITALSQTTVGVEKQILIIRPDKDLHRDIGLQKIILELFISYNPLWLRIGLETVYKETIPLQSNNDIIGLSRFLINRFFSDPYLVKTHSSQAHPTIRHSGFQVLMNKFMLKKFLFIVYFLDYAKRNKLIGHDPCLFRKNALIKDSRSILLTFSRELLSGIGDVTKVLRNYNYEVSHKQTYLDEYDYAVKSLCTDLRDGVRLCRVMELITGKRCLTCRCRVPAISRLQKVHNVNVALVTLKEYGYVITGDIDGKSIADGHKEKTLSLLWQIIYKFQAPRFERAAKVLQRWWRSKLWLVHVRNLLRNRKDEAARAIQMAWKCCVARRLSRRLREERARELEAKAEAARTIQSYWRLRREAKSTERRYQEAKASAIRIQRWWRRRRATGPYVEERRRKRDALVRIQRHWRGWCATRAARAAYVKLKGSAMVIQCLWRARSLGKRASRDYEEKRRAITFIQKRYRMKLAARAERELYLRKLEAARRIQRAWRNLELSRRLRREFVALKRCVRLVESTWLGKRLTREERKSFLLKRDKAIVIQRAWRRYRATRHDRRLHGAKKASAVRIQSWWRSVLAARSYKSQRDGCTRLQRWWRAVRLGRRVREDYARARASATVLQKTWRMRSARRAYARAKSSVLLIESWYVGAKVSRSVRLEYERLRLAVRVTESRWLARAAGKTARIEYSRQRGVIIALQRRWRARRLGESARLEYLEKRASAIRIQRMWRSYAASKELARRRRAVRLIEEWRAARLVGLGVREDFLALRSAAVRLQSQWRMLARLREYGRERRAARTIQRWWRRRRWLEARRAGAATVIQRYWRSSREARDCRLRYENTRAAALTIQRRYRARLRGQAVRRDYLARLAAARTIQGFWRAALERSRHLATRRKLAVALIEDWWTRAREVRRARLAELQELRRLERAATVIQTAWRGYRVRLIASKKMAMLRERAKKAAEAAIPSATLAFRLQENIEIFMNASNIGQLSVCLSSLDIITRLSPNACVNVCQLNLVSKLYDILTRANRSLPWLDVCLKDISILLTLAKFKPTRAFVLEEEYIEVLVRLLTISVAKKDDLFLHTATLIWVLIQDQQYAEAIHSCSRTKYLLGSLYASINKKLNNRPPVASNNSKPKGADCLPSPKPDWGLRHKRPRTFTSVSQAITSIASRLNILNVIPAANLQRSFNFSI